METATKVFEEDKLSTESGWSSPRKGEYKRFEGKTYKFCKRKRELTLQVIELPGVHRVNSIICTMMFMIK